MNCLKEKNRALSLVEHADADSFIFGGGIPEHRVLATDRLALSTSAPHTPVVLVSSSDTARSPKPGLHEDSGSRAQPSSIETNLLGPHAQREDEARQKSTEHIDLFDFHSEEG